MPRSASRPTAARSAGAVAVPTVAPAALRQLLGGPVVTLHVVLAGRSGVYLETTSGAPVALLTADAARLPFALVLPPDTPAPAPSDPARIGGGALVLGDHRYVAARWRTDQRLERRPLTGRMVRRAADLSVRTADCAVPGARIEALGDLRPEQLEAAVHRLVGYGPGATPAGDDLLAGLYTALASFGHPAAATLATSILIRLDRTTWLSGALLRSTLAGRPADDLAALPRLADSDDLRWETAVHRLLGFGHTSGPAAAQGFALGVRHG